MSDLVPSVVALSAGLSLQVPKLMAPPGSLLDVLNYEQVDMQGQKRIDGYARYDGGLLSALNDFHVMPQADFDEAGWDSVENILLINGVPFGILVGQDIDNQTAHIVSLNDNLIPELQMGRDVYTDPEQHYELLLEYMDVLRSRTEQLPGAVAGLHWFRDRLYSVADTMRIVVNTGGTLIYPNDIIEAFGSTSKVLQVYPNGSEMVLFIDTMYADDWQLSGVEVRRNGVVIGTTSGYLPHPDRPEIASFFESRTEAQVLAEDDGPYDFGWRFVDLGWEIEFEQGLSLYGDLPSLNQNLQGVGVQGPSPITGNNGSPLVLTQNVNITNSRPQVNGWKNSNTPATYGLSPSNITATDTEYIYADAYVSWDGTTRAVTALRDNLVEYPPTATVEVEV